MNMPENVNKSWDALSYEEKRAIFWKKFNDREKEIFKKNPHYHREKFGEILIDHFDVLTEALFKKQLDPYTLKVTARFNLELDTKGELPTPVVYNLGEQDFITEQKQNEVLEEVLDKSITAEILSFLTADRTIWRKDGKICKLGYRENDIIEQISKATNLIPEQKDLLIFKHSALRIEDECPLKLDKEDKTIFVNAELEISPAKVNLDNMQAYYDISMSFNFFEGIRKGFIDFMLSKIELFEPTKPREHNNNKDRVDIYRKPVLNFVNENNKKIITLNRKELVSRHSDVYTYISIMYDTGKATYSELFTKKELTDTNTLTSPVKQAIKKVNDTARNITANVKFWVLKAPKTKKGEEKYYQLNPEIIKYGSDNR